MASRFSEAHAKTTGRSSAGGRVRKRRDHIVLFVSLLMSLLLCAPVFADALTVNTTTARSNESGTGNAVLGGLPTRVTWEASVGGDESISSLHLDFPSGCDFKSASVKVTALNGLNRTSITATSDFVGDGIDVTFSSPVPSGSTLRLEIQDVSLPAEGGTVVITGTYVNSSGATLALGSSPEINVERITFTERIVNALDNAAWCQAWNSNKFLGTFLKPQLIVSSIPSLFVGWLRALMLVFIGFPIAIPIGLCFSFLKMAKHKVFNVLAAIYVNVIRGTPLFLQIYIAFFGFPLMGIQINNYVLGVAVLAINSSAYLCEIFRAGIQSIHKGQFEAAASLGMTRSQTMFNVIIPQTVRRVIPTMTSEFILLYKDSSLLSAVGVMELMMFSKSITATTGNITPYIVAALYYLAVTLPLIKVVNTFERKIAKSDGSVSGDDKKEAKKAAKAEKKEAKKAAKAGSANRESVPAEVTGSLTTPRGQSTLACVQDAPATLTGFTATDNGMGGHDALS